MECQIQFGIQVKLERGREISHPTPLPTRKRTKRGKMAATARASGLVLSRPVTFVTGNAKKLEEVRAILGNSIPFQSLKLDCKFSHTHTLCLSLSEIHSMFLKSG